MKLKKGDKVCLAFTCAGFTTHTEETVRVVRLKKFWLENFDHAFDMDTGVYQNNGFAGASMRVLSKTV